MSSYHPSLEKVMEENEEEVLSECETLASPKPYKTLVILFVFLGVITAITFACGLTTLVQNCLLFYLYQNKLYPAFGIGVGAITVTSSLMGFLTLRTRDKCLVFFVLSVELVTVCANVVEICVCFPTTKWDSIVDLALTGDARAKRISICVSSVVIVCCCILHAIFLSLYTWKTRLAENLFT
ncbi:unnamed protein product [Calicophoron daubneyi]|uniref:Uncharacterized protein n=1 Tax=Calicophoron daubneyi TaxID=300641 RepID=A0AAV2TDZ0_CALDB